MTESREPRRLLDGHEFAFTEIVRGLGQARVRGPDAQQLARMRLELNLAAAAPELIQMAESPDHVQSRTQAASPAPTVGRIAVKWLKLILTSACALGCGVWLWQASRFDAPATVSSPAQASRTRAPVLEVTSSAAIETTSQTASSTLPAVANMPAPNRIKRLPRSPLSARPPQPTAAVTGAVNDPLVELALLKRARASARSAPQQALLLIAEHERDFTRGMLVEEREVIAIEALLALGQRAAAEDRARRFGERFGNSAHARRVRVLLSAAQSDKNATTESHPPR